MSYPVNVGHDYHHAEVSAWHYTGNRTGYTAECKACDWVGPERDKKDAAEDDATAHDIASNPPSNRDKS